MPALEVVLLTWERILQNASGHAEKQKTLLEQKGWRVHPLYIPSQQENVWF